MIATVKDRRDGQVLAGFVGEDAARRAYEFAGQHPDVGGDALDIEQSTGTQLSVQTRDLRPGDVLVPTLACFLGSRGRNGKVYPRASSGVDTPRGKLDVLLRHPQGRLREIAWGRYTRLTVVRHTSEED